MVFNIQGWSFDIDLDATKAYSEELCVDHCECGYCKNYYQALPDSYPSFFAFLDGLGINHEGPVDFLPVEPTLCIVSYPICGKVIRYGNKHIELDSVSISVQESTELDYTLSCKEPYFVVTTNALVLPWLLEEDRDEVISPANEPECLERMWTILLRDADFFGFQS